MEDLKERRKLSYQGLFYGVQRIDLLTITINGAGTYLCLETMKLLHENDNADLFLVKFSGIVFLLSIGFNFLSQIYGRKSNEEDYLMCDIEIKARKNLNDGENLSQEKLNEIEIHDKKSELYANKTNFLTNLSVFLMFFGLLSIVLYFLFIF